jgi:hypothetical protein
MKSLFCSIIIANLMSFSAFSGPIDDSFVDKCKQIKIGMSMKEIEGIFGTKFTKIGIPGSYYQISIPDVALTHKHQESDPDPLGVVVRFGFDNGKMVVVGPPNHYMRYYKKQSNKWEWERIIFREIKETNTPTSLPERPRITFPPSKKSLAAPFYPP